MACPSMFYNAPITEDAHDSKEMRVLFADLHAVLLAWQRMKRMIKSTQKWSESDYANNVYAVFRSPGIRESTYRAHCSISLPRPLKMQKVRQSIETPQLAVPDSSIFIRPSSIRGLSQGSNSPYMSLRRDLGAFIDPEQNGMRNEATPCTNIGSKDRFEFISSCWEDKRTTDDLLDSAYRQNRMACAAACRHLRAFKINLPVFGVIWAQGKVMVHVDWCTRSKDVVCNPDSIFCHCQPRSSSMSILQLIRAKGKATQRLRVNMNQMPVHRRKDLVHPISSSTSSISPNQRISFRSTVYFEMLTRGHRQPLKRRLSIESPKLPLELPLGKSSWSPGKRQLIDVPHYAL